ncbi:MAG: SHOCT domain-containing protein [Desulfobacterales bacterium]|nr:SHOCT domain-containing protein [Desulfobacterales bacterium]
MKRVLQFTMGSVFGLVISSASNAFAQWRGYGWGHGPWMMGGNGMGWFGGIFMVIFWIAVVIGIVFLIRWLMQSTRGGAGSTESALEILKRRYAAGEINKKEFDQKKKDLL